MSMKTTVVLNNENEIEVSFQASPAQAPPPPVGAVARGRHAGLVRVAPSSALLCRLARLVALGCPRSAVVALASNVWSVSPRVCSSTHAGKESTMSQHLFNSTILDDTSASEACDALHLPNTSANRSLMGKGYDIFARGLVSFSHASPPDERVYLVRSQGRYEETKDRVYRVNVNGSFLFCTCPQCHHLIRLFTDRHPDLPCVFADDIECKHGVAVRLFEIYERERNAYSDSFPPSRPEPCKYQPSHICYCKDPRFCPRVNNNPRENGRMGEWANERRFADSQVRVSALAEGDEAVALRWREER